MDNNLILKKTMLPPNLKDQTLQNIVNECDEFSVKGKTVKMKKVTSEGIMTITFDGYANGNIVSKSEFDNLEKKKDYKQAVQQMYRNGMSQEDIAFALNISQSYVSKLLNEE